MPKKEQYQALNTQLLIQRRHLSVFLQQGARFGVLVPPHISLQIEEKRAHIYEIKRSLEVFGIPVEDHAIDFDTTPNRLDESDAVPISEALPATPNFAVRVLHWIPMNAVARANLLGDLEEEFQHHYRHTGPLAATSWYYRQVIGSLGPLWARALLQWLRAAYRRLGA